MKSKLIMTALLALNIGLPGVHASEEGGAARERPAVGAASLITLNATVTAVNQETREVTLKGADGNELAITVGEEVKNLPQVEVGDQLEVAYYESVNVEVLGPEQAEPGHLGVDLLGEAGLAIERLGRGPHHLVGEPPGGLADLRVDLGLVERYGQHHRSPMVTSRLSILDRRPGVNRPPLEITIQLFIFAAAPSTIAAFRSDTERRRPSARYRCSASSRYTSITTPVSAASPASAMNPTPTATDRL